LVNFAASAWVFLIEGIMVPCVRLLASSITTWSLVCMSFPRWGDHGALSSTLSFVHHDTVFSVQLPKNVLPLSLPFTISGIINMKCGFLALLPRRTKLWLNINSLIPVFLVGRLDKELNIPWSYVLDFNLTLTGRLPCLNLNP